MAWAKWKLCCVFRCFDVGPFLMRIVNDMRQTRAHKFGRARESENVKKKTEKHLRRVCHTAGQEKRWARTFFDEHIKCNEPLPLRPPNKWMESSRKSASRSHFTSHACIAEERRYGRGRTAQTEAHQKHSLMERYGQRATQRCDPKRMPVLWPQWMRWFMNENKHYIIINKSKKKCLSTKKYDLLAGGSMCEQCISSTALQLYIDGRMKQ